MVYNTVVVMGKYIIWPVLAMPSYCNENQATDISSLIYYVWLFWANYSLVWKYYLYSHFIEEKTEVQRAFVIGSRSQDW